jgi:hypothetical protein
MSRKTWVYRTVDGKVEVYEKGTEPPMDVQTRVPVLGDLHYLDTRGPNGEDLSTRTKHREFMRASGLTTMDDYKTEWRKAAEKRSALLNNTDQPTKRERREAVERAMYFAHNPR